jgi:hypothetical protein
MRMRVTHLLPFIKQAVMAIRGVTNRCVAGGGAFSRVLGDGNQPVAGQGATMSAAFAHGPKSAGHPSIRIV